MINVLHITPHLNGGLGRVMLSTLKSNFYENSLVSHRIVLTEPLTGQARAHFNGYLNLILDGLSDEEIKREIDQADILQIEWWNHPLVYKLLYTFVLPKCRLVVSSHVSGFHRPQIINKNIIGFSDVFLCTTEATSKHPVVLELSPEEFSEKIAFVKYPVDLERFDGFTPQSHDGINIGYAGTLDYSKLHPKFLQMSADVNLPDINFLICGADDNNQIQNEAQKFQQTNFEFLGFQPDIKKFFEKLDIFAYPLNQRHFGSGEQVIIEAMYAGLPVVAFSNPAESEIINHGETGILVHTEKEYSDAITKLCLDQKLREKLGRNARDYIMKNLSPEDCFTELNKTYKSLMRRKKRHHTINSIHDLISMRGDSDPDLGSKLFAESIGIKNNCFVEFFFNRNKSNAARIDKAITATEQSLRVKTKGSIYQYLFYFPNDQFLNFWCGLIDLDNGNRSAAICKFKKAQKGQANIEFNTEYIDSTEKMFELLRSADVD